MGFQGLVLGSGGLRFGVEHRQLRSGFGHGVEG